jgi:hypothetical protein
VRGRTVVGVNTDPAFALSMIRDLCSYRVGKPLKKPTPGQAALGLEPGTSRLQSGALGAWPRCSVVLERSYGVTINATVSH